MKLESKIGLIGLAAVMLGTSAIAQESIEDKAGMPAKATLTTVPSQKNITSLTLSSIGRHPGCQVGAISKSDPRCN